MLYLLFFRFLWLIFLGKKLLLLDLDETLIHSETIPYGTMGSGDYDFVVNLPNQNGHDFDSVKIQKTQFCLFRHFSKILTSSGST